MLWALPGCYYRNWETRLAPTVRGLVWSSQFEWVTKHCLVACGLHSCRLLATANELYVMNFSSCFSKFPTFFETTASSDFKSVSSRREVGFCLLAIYIYFHQGIWITLSWDEMKAKLWLKDFWDSVSWWFKGECVQFIAFNLPLLSRTRMAILINLWCSKKV